MRRFLSALVGLFAIARGEALAAALPVALEKKDDRVIIRIGNDPFTEVRFKGDSKQFLYPLLSPDGSHVTRRWPEEDVQGEEHDHPHHRGLWFAHGDVNGFDFWTGEMGKSRIDLVEVVEAKGGEDSGVLRVKSAWNHEKEHVLDEVRTYRFSGTEGTRTIDVEIALTAPDKDAVFGDTKEGTMALRLAETLRLKGAAAQGKARNSEGVAGAEIWGKRAKFVAYEGPIGEKAEKIGVALFDDPKNPRYPTWWHARDYGLFAANPFGQHDFEGKAEKSGNLTIPKGSTVTFRYRLVIYRGEKSLADLASLAPR